MLKPVNVLKQPVWFHSCQVTLSRNGLSREHHLQSHFARHSTAHCNPWGGTEQSHVDAARRYPGTRSVIGYYWLSLVTAKYQFFPLAITNPCWYCRSRRHSKDNEKERFLKKTNCSEPITVIFCGVHAGLPQVVTVGPPMPSSSQIQ